jgi:hypothetical protein
VNCDSQEMEPLKILLEAADGQTGGLWTIPEEGPTDSCGLAG